MASIKNSRTMNEIEAKLRVPEKYRRIWIGILFITLLLLGLTAIPIACIYAKTLDQSIIANINQNFNYAISTKFFVFSSYVLIFIPYLYLAASWIVGIDNITKSRNFHLALWITYALAALFIILSIIFCFRAWMY